MEFCCKEMNFHINDDRFCAFEDNSKYGILVYVKSVEEANKLNLTLLDINGKLLAVEPIEYCPWCGKKL